MLSDKAKATALPLCPPFPFFGRRAGGEHDQKEVHEDNDLHLRDTVIRIILLYTWRISNWARFYLGSFLNGLNSNCIPS